MLREICQQAAPAERVAASWCRPWNDGTVIDRPTRFPMEAAATGAAAVGIRYGVHMKQLLGFLWLLVMAGGGRGTGGSCTALGGMQTDQTSSWLTMPVVWPGSNVLDPVLATTGVCYTTCLTLLRD